MYAKIEFEIVKPFQARKCWTSSWIVSGFFFLFSFLPHVVYEKDLFEGICCFRGKALKKDSEPLFCFPDHPIDYEGSLFFSTRNKKETIHMEKLLQCLLFLLLSSKAHFPLTKRPFVVKKIFLINLKVTRPAFFVCISQV